MAFRSLPRALARIGLAAAVTCTAGTAVAVASAPSAYAESTTQMESEFIAKMNAARQANGQRPYAVYADLTAVARGHSRDMAARQELYHNPNLASDVHDWQAVGENVGEGPTVTAIHDAFMQSPEHRANILDHDFTQVGVGVTVDSNGTVWVTEDFREPQSAAPAPAPAHTAGRTPAAGTSPTRTASAPQTAAPARHQPARTASAATTAAPLAAAPASQEATPATRQLRERLAAARRTAARSAGADPVAQTFGYLEAISRLGA